jgi:hypothetical protein
MTDLVDQTPAVEPEPEHADLHARVRQSVEMTKLARRVSDLEAKVKAQHEWMIRMEQAGINVTGHGYNL